MKKKKMYIALGLLAIARIGGYLIYKRRKAKSSDVIFTFDQSGSNSGSTSNATSQGANTPFGSLNTIQKAIKIAQEKGINYNNLNRRVA